MVPTRKKRLRNAVLDFGTTDKPRRGITRDHDVGVCGATSWLKQCKLTSHVTFLPTDQLMPKQPFVLNLDGAFEFPHSCSVTTFQSC
jgi:hypothetical protein